MATKSRLLYLILRSFPSKKLKQILAFVMQMI